MGRKSKFHFGKTSRSREEDVEADTPDLDWDQYGRAPYGVFLPSKAERLLGASGLPSGRYPRSASPQYSASTPNLEIRPSYATTTASEADIELDTETSGTGTVEGIAIAPQWRTIHPKPSSNLLGVHNYDTPRSGSVSSYASGRLHHHDSSSTLRSYYDPKKSPLAISQQTSASAVRDMALRKGHPSKLRDLVEYNGSTESLHGTKTADDAGASASEKGSRRKSPGKLDLSALFPKPKKPGTHGGVMLSPTKFVDSPDRMSATTEYFTAHASHPRGGPKAPPVKNNKSIQQERRVLTKPNPKSPLRRVERDTYDNAKVNVRTPPGGIKNWFDGLLEEEDEDDPAEEQHILETETSIEHRPYHPNAHPTSSPVEGHPIAGKTFDREVARVDMQPQYLNPVSHFSTSTQQTGLQSSRRERRESHGSLYSHVTCTSARTRENKISSSNLQTDSILSFSSEEEEDVNTRPPVAVHGSLAVMVDNDGRVIMGKAPSPGVSSQSSNGRRKIPPEVDISYSTARTDNALYPTSKTEPLPLPSKSRTRRQSCAPQPLSIPENDLLPSPTTLGTVSTIASPTASTFARSNRNSRISESSTHQHEQHKFMAVTEEEEALLEMMRRKRAAMAKHNFTQGYKTALKQEKMQTWKKSNRQPPPAPIDLSAVPPPRTSGYLEAPTPYTPGHISPGLPGEVLGAFPTPDALKERTQGVDGESSPILGYGSAMISVHSHDHSRPRKTQHTDPPRHRDSTLRLSPAASDSSRPPSQSQPPPTSSSSSSAKPQPYHLPTPHLSFSPLSISIPSPTLPISTPTTLTSPTTTATTRESQVSPIPPLTPSHHPLLTTDGHYAGDGCVTVRVAGSASGSVGDGSDEGEGVMGMGEGGWCHAITTDSVPERPKLGAPPRTGSRGPDARLAESAAGAYLLEHSSSSAGGGDEAFELPAAGAKFVYHRTPLASLEPVGSTNKRRSTVKSRANSGRAAGAARVGRQESVRVRERGEGIAVVGGPRVRSSVSEDVLEAWGSLGGWTGGCGRAVG